MACQGFPTFLGTKYYYFFHFQHQHQLGFSVLYDEYYIYDYLDTSMAPTILLTEIHPTNKLSPNIVLSDFTLLETTLTTQKKTTTPNNDDAVS